MPLEQIPEQIEGVNLVNIHRKDISSRKTSKDEGPEVGVDIVGLKNSKSIKH